MGGNDPCIPGGDRCSAPHHHGLPAFLYIPVAGLHSKCLSSATLCNVHQRLRRSHLLPRVNINRIGAHLPALQLRDPPLGRRCGGRAGGRFMSVGFRQGEGRRPRLSRRLCGDLCVILCIEFRPSGGRSLRRSFGWRPLLGRRPSGIFCVELSVRGFRPMGGGHRGLAVRGLAGPLAGTFAGIAGIAGLAG